VAITLHKARNPAQHRSGSLCLWHRSASCIAAATTRIDNVNDLSHRLRLASQEIQRRDAAQEETPDVMCWLHAVLETAALRDLECGAKNKLRNQCW